MAPTGPRRPGQRTIEVDEHRARDVAAQIQIEPGRTTELPADVEQHGPLGTEPRRQLVNGDQRHYRFPIAYWRIDRSVSHSTGALSSVYTLPPVSAGPSRPAI